MKNERNVDSHEKFFMKNIRTKRKVQKEKLKKCRLYFKKKKSNEKRCIFVVLLQIDMIPSDRPNIEK